MLHIHDIKTESTYASVIATSDNAKSGSLALGYLLSKMGSDILMEHNIGDLDDCNWERMTTSIAAILDPQAPTTFTLRLLKDAKPELRFSATKAHSTPGEGETSLYTDVSVLKAV